MKINNKIEVDIEGGAREGEEITPVNVVTEEIKDKIKKKKEEGRGAEEAEEIVPVKVIREEIIGNEEKTNKKKDLEKNIKARTEI